MLFCSSGGGAHRTCWTTRQLRVCQTSLIQSPHGYSIIPCSKPNQSPLKNLNHMTNQPSVRSQNLKNCLRISFMRTQKALLLKTMSKSSPISVQQDPICQSKKRTFECEVLLQLACVKLKIRQHPQVSQIWQKMMSLHLLFLMFTNNLPSHVFGKTRAVMRTKMWFQFVKLLMGKDTITVKTKLTFLHNETCKSTLVLFCEWHSSFGFLFVSCFVQFNDFLCLCFDDWRIFEFLSVLFCWWKTFLEQKSPHVSEFLSVLSCWVKNFLGTEISSQMWIFLFQESFSPTKQKWRNLRITQYQRKRKSAFVVGWKPFAFVFVTEIFAQMSKLRSLLQNDTLDPNPPSPNTPLAKCAFNKQTWSLEQNLLQHRARNLGTWAGCCSDTIWGKSETQSRTAGEIWQGGAHFNPQSLNLLLSLAERALYHIESLQFRVFILSVILLDLSLLVVALVHSETRFIINLTWRSFSSPSLSHSQMNHSTTTNTAHPHNLHHGAWQKAFWSSWWITFVVVVVVVIGCQVVIVLLVKGWTWQTCLWLWRVLLCRWWGAKHCTISDSCSISQVRVPTPTSIANMWQTQIVPFQICPFSATAPSGVCGATWSCCSQTSSSTTDQFKQEKILWLWVWVGPHVHHWPRHRNESSRNQLGELLSQFHHWCCKVSLFFKSVRSSSLTVFVLRFRCAGTWTCSMAKKYCVVNLRQERQYDTKPFHDRVTCQPIQDHNPAPLHNCASSVTKLALFWKKMNKMLLLCTAEVAKDELAWQLVVSLCLTFESHVFIFWQQRDVKHAQRSCWTVASLTQPKPSWVSLLADKLTNQSRNAFREFKHQANVRLVCSQ